jgi:polysaccharide biosynthesis transport protein
MRTVGQHKSPAFEIIDYWHMLLRRKWLALAIFLTCVVGGGILCVVLPKSYRSSTVVLVESQKVPEKYVNDLVGPGNEERLRSIEHQIMSRSLLTRMIQEFALYPDVLRRNGIDTVVDRIRKDIRVVTTDTSLSRGGIDTFTISFVHQDPQLAMKVTAKLASQFIEDNLRSREELVEKAAKFLDEELVTAKQRLEAQDQSISFFKTKYMGELPEQMQANISALDRLSLQHSATLDAFQKASDRLSLIEKTIKNHEASEAITSSPTQRPGVTPTTDPLVLRLTELEKALTTLSIEFKDTYPDIIAIKQEIKALKSQLQSKAGKNDEADAAKTITKEATPVEAYFRELARQHEESKLEIASLKDRLFRIKEEMKVYERRVEVTPKREQELKLLERDYENLKGNYRSLLDKKLNAELSEHLERRRKGEQFRIIDPANLPQNPETPNRMRIMTLALALGCGLGVGSVVAPEFFRPVFRRPDDVERLLQLRVLALIPYFGDVLGAKEKSHFGHARTSTLVRATDDQFLSARAPGDKGNGASVSMSVGGEPGLPGVRRSVRSDGSASWRELDLIAKWNPVSVAAEQFRVAAARLVLMRSGSGGEVTIVTSAIKAEGKSVVAANLAYVFAKSLDKATLLIDGDLKCPTVHQCMGTSQSPGLSNVLEGGRSIDSCLHRMGESPLWVLPSGIASDRSLELSDIRKLSSMLSALKKQYEYIFIDAPPILPLADMHILTGMADTLVIVVRAGFTPQEEVKRAVRAIGATSGTCIILNGLEAGGVPYYIRDGYEYLSKKKVLGIMPKGVKSGQ